MGKFGTQFMKKLSAIATSFSNIFETHHTTIVNIVGVIIAFAAEWFVEDNIFSCPCTKDLALKYGASFIIGGFVIFWMIGLIIYTQTWRACHGCCAPCKKETCWTNCSHFGNVCVKTLVFPLAWVFALGIDGDYIACMLSKTCKEGTDDYENAKKKSQVYSFWGLCGLLALFIACRSICRCRNNSNYLHYTFLEAYETAEEGAFNQKITERANSVATEVVNTFFKEKDLRDEDWNQATNKNENIGTFFSPLHKFVENRKQKPRAADEKPANLIEV